MVFIEQIISFVWFLCYLFSFSEFDNMQTVRQRHINYETFSNQITRLLVEEVEAELGYKCEMSGGSMPRDIESISVGFAIDERASVDRAREIEVEITERFLRIINSHEKIRPFLREYPFPASRAKVELSFYDSRKQKRQHGDCVCLVYQVRGNIFYESSPAQEKYELVEIAREKYEDALEIVKRNRPTSF